LQTFGRSFNRQTTNAIPFEPFLALAASALFGPLITDAAKRDFHSIMSEQPQLLERIAAKDFGAVEACINRYGKFIWSMARHFSNSPEEVEGSTTAIFLDIWRTAGNFESSGLEEIAFITAVARCRLHGSSAPNRRFAPKKKDVLLTNPISGFYHDTPSKSEPKGSHYDTHKKITRSIFRRRSRQPGDG